MFNFPLAVGNPSMDGSMLCQEVLDMVVAYVDVEIATGHAELKYLPQGYRDSDALEKLSYECDGDLLWWIYSAH